MYVSKDPVEIRAAVEANQVVHADPREEGSTLLVEDARLAPDGELEVFAISLDEDSPAAWVRPARVWVLHSHRGFTEQRLSARAHVDRRQLELDEARS